MTSHFAVLEGDEVIYLAKHDPPGLGLKLASSLGARLPAAVTAVGKAQLARKDWGPDDAVDGVAARRATPVGAQQDRTELDSELQRCAASATPSTTGRRPWASGAWRLLCSMTGVAVAPSGSATCWAEAPGAPRGRSRRGSRRASLGPPGWRAERLGSATRETDCSPAAGPAAARSAPRYPSAPASRGGRGPGEGGLGRRVRLGPPRPADGRMGGLLAGDLRPRGGRGGRRSARAARWPAGTVVVVDSRLPCGKCAGCQKAPSLCHNMSWLGEALPGGFARHLVVPVTSLVRCPAQLEPAIAVLAEPLAVAMHAVSRLAHRPDDVLVLGYGPVGALVHLELVRRWPGLPCPSPRSSSRDASWPWPWGRPCAPLPRCGGGQGAATPAASSSWWWTPPGTPSP